MKLNTLLLAAGLLTASSSTFAAAFPVAPAYHYDSQDRHLNGFHSISVSGSFDVYVVQGGSESVRVEADRDDLDHIVTEVQNGDLKIYSKSTSGWGWNWSSKKKVVYVSVKDVNAISVSGSSDVYFKEGIRAHDLKLRVSGSGDLAGQVDVTNLESSVSGSGDIKLSGKAENSDVMVAGSGDFTAANLVTLHTTVKVHGSGDAKVNVNQQLDASAAGSGDIRYTGTARHISKSTTGSASISRM